MKEKLATVSSITLTADVWTDTMNVIGYLGTTVHFPLNGKINSVTIGITELHESDTTDYIGNVLMSTCNEWLIQVDKIAAVVTDNANNMSKAVCDTFGNNKQLSCFEHSLNLVTDTVINNNSDLKELVKVKSIVTYFKQSVKAADELRKAQPVQTPLKLIQEVSTRWNSMYYMLERFIRLLDHVIRGTTKF